LNVWGDIENIKNLKGKITCSTKQQVQKIYNIQKGRQKYLNHFNRTDIKLRHYEKPLLKRTLRDALQRDC